jgi:hypothetical protein
LARESYHLACEFCLRPQPQSGLRRMTRATSLGEFSPMVRLFTLDSVLNITEVAQIFKATFFPRNQLCIT